MSDYQALTAAIRELSNQIAALQGLIQPTRLAYTPAEAAGLIGLTYRGVLKLIEDHELQAVPAGRGYVIPIEELRRFLRQTPADAAA